VVTLQLQYAQVPLYWLHAVLARCSFCLNTIAVLHLCAVCLRQEALEQLSQLSHACNSLCKMQGSQPRSLPRCRSACWLCGTSTGRWWRTTRIRGLWSSWVQRLTSCACSRCEDWCHSAWFCRSTHRARLGSRTLEQRSVRAIRLMVSCCAVCFRPGTLVTWAHVTACGILALHGCCLLGRARLLRGICPQEVVGWTELMDASMAAAASAHGADEAAVRKAARSVPIAPEIIQVGWCSVL
jgi:hypothetical protein